MKSTDDIMTKAANFIAHKTESGKIQTVSGHLRQTARLAAGFAMPFKSEIFAEQMGLGHDLGKYSNEFQKRILYNGPKVDHSTAGGIEICRINGLCGRILAYGMLGHHGGMPDGGNKSDTADNNTLQGRLKRIPGKHICIYESFNNEICLEKFKAVPEMLSKKPPDGFTLSFLIRMLFSCLVDADYQDTEEFMTGHKVNRGGSDSLEVLLARLETYIEPWWNPKTEINKKRCEILKTCIEKAKGERGIYSLTVPTGGGKTVASLAFALNHAIHKEESMQRIIYVIPFTSIIEQNAEVFGKILGEVNVVEHHANVSYDSEADQDIDSILNERKRLAVENWDAPVIVTTNVQFFESLFSNKPGKCRKLHNIANSVIIFDEAQMLPLQYLKPCMRAITELVENYNCTVVLCTATQPALEKFIPDDLKYREICENTEGLFRFFKRTTVKQAGKLTDDELVFRLKMQYQVLCIVNSRKQAQYLYQEIDDEQNTFHLSTYMTPVHRKYVLNVVRSRLQNHEPCRLIATSLIEAGVDVDFPIVYRARAGLDCIIQAAGRGNREGKRAPEESYVYVFDPEKKYTDHYPAFIDTGKSIERETESNYQDITSPEAIKSYFDLLHKIAGEELDEKDVLKMLDKGLRNISFPFKTIASRFKLIEQDTKMLMIPFGIKGCKWENRPKELADKIKLGEINKLLLREVGLYSVNVYDHQYNDLINSGQIEAIDGQIAVLADENIYNEKTGLTIVIEEGKGFFV